MTWSAITDAERQAIVDALPGGIDGFLKGWGWQQFAQAIEAKCREKNWISWRAIGPCPFCGTETPIALDKMEGTTHYIHCASCGASGPECLSLQDAIEGWERATRPLQQGTER